MIKPGRKLFFLLTASMLFLNSCGSDISQDELPPSEETAAVETSKPIEKEKLVGSITITPYNEVGFLQDAIVKFNRLYPKVYINIKEGVVYDPNDMDVDMSERYSQRVQMELMSGYGSDIINTGYYAPYYHLVDNRLLTDLNECINDDLTFNKDDYYMNVLDAFAVDGGIYMFPICYIYKLISYNNKLEDNLGGIWDNYDGIDYSRLLDLYQTLSVEQKQRYYVEPSYSLTNAVYFEIRKYVDFEKKTCDINNRDFIEFIEAVKRVEMPDVLDGSFDTHDYYSRTDELAVSARNVFQHIDNSSVQYFCDVVNSDFTNYIPLFEGSGKIGVNPYMGYSIKANITDSKKKIAWEFVKFLASEQATVGYYTYGNPIKKGSFKMAARYKLNEYLNLMKSDGYILRNDNRNDNINLAISRMEEINKMPMMYARPGTDIYTMLMKEFDEFRRDLISAEQVAANLQNKIYVYLNQ